MNKGIWYAIGGYAWWGLFPIYWRWLRQVAAIELISHRIIWSCVILWGIVLVTRQWKTFRQAAFAPRVLLIYSIAALVLTINWFVYVWSVNAGFIVESSLGYFINPLVSVLLGVVLLRERLRPLQWLPIGLALLGVIYLTMAYGALPWIALTLAGTFGAYGLVKKVAPLNSLHGLTLETSIVLVPALAYLIFAEATSQGAFLHDGMLADGLMMGAGVVTTVPLLLFASAMRHIPLSLVGVLQYITPTLQFLLGVLVYGESFTPTQFIGFGIIWFALIIFGVEGLIHRRAPPVAAIAE